MTSGQYIQKKLQAWAERKQIRLQGSEGERGEPNYTMTVEQNLFGGVLSDSVATAFKAGAGRELEGSIPAMSALHSSSAMAVNLFQYWMLNKELATLAKLLDVPSQNISTVGFEEKFPVCNDPKARGFGHPPHLDFALRYSDGSCVGIECKLFEPYYQSKHEPLKPPYLALSDEWADLPSCRALANRLAASSDGYDRLGASQLIKHILGLRFCAPKSKMRLLYLYNDAIGDEAAEHRQQLRQFQTAIAPDSLRFVPLSVQEFILRATRIARANHAAYVDYLAERYL